MYNIFSCSYTTSANVKRQNAHSIERITKTFWLSVFFIAYEYYTEPIDNNDRQFPLCLCHFSTNALFKIFFSFLVVLCGVKLIFLSNSNRLLCAECSQLRRIYSLRATFKIQCKEFEVCMGFDTDKRDQKTKIKRMNKNKTKSKFRSE